MVGEQTLALRGPANTRVVQLFCRCWWRITFFNRHWNVSSAWSLPDQYFSLCCSSCLCSFCNGFVGCIVYIPRRAHTPPTCRPNTFFFSCFFSSVFFSLFFFFRFFFSPPRSVCQTKEPSFFSLIFPPHALYVRHVSRLCDFPKHEADRMLTRRRYQVCLLDC